MSQKVIVLCPNGRRQTVPVTPNTSILHIQELVCTKQGFDMGVHRLVHHNKPLDPSNTVRFAGLPNQAQLELEECEATTSTNVNVSVCLQLPDGQRLVEDFPNTSTLDLIQTRWADKIGQPEQGEEPVMVYMRREIVGSELAKTTIRTLGLTQGKGLFRFFFKKPETLKDQANVSHVMSCPMKPEPPKEPTPEPEKEAKTNSNNDKNYLQIAKDELKMPKEDDLPMQSSSDVQTAAIKPSQSSQPKNIESTKPEPMETAPPTAESTTPPEPRPGPSTSNASDAGPEPTPGPSTETPYTAPDSSPYIEPIVNFIGPKNDAIVFSSALESPAFRDLDDDFFNLKITDVKVLHRDLKTAVKHTDEGGPLMTAAMRKAQEEGAKLALLSRYRHAVLRIQFSNRLVVQGVFSPGTTVQEVQDWLAPLLTHPAGGELYTAPPRTTLPPSSTLLDLGLLPAALVHFSSPSAHLTELATENLSNAAGANVAAAKYRKGKDKPETGLKGELPNRTSVLPSIMESRPGKRPQEDNHHVAPRSGASHGGETKVPRWFKTGK